MLTLLDICWAAEECERQKSGEMSVSHLCNALDFVRGDDRHIQLEDIVLIGKLVEPVKNADGFRRVPVYFEGFVSALPPTQIEPALTSLLNIGTDLPPTEWYKEFELIHPFIDGNGRVGALLFNLKNGTIQKPIAPPDLFKGDI